jgi:Ca2+-binding RTX toxin-like protein
VANEATDAKTTSTLTLRRSLISGNTAYSDAEVYNIAYGTVTANNHNLFGHSGLTNAQAFLNFTPGTTDLTATSNGTTPTALSAILNTTLANNGGSTQTHDLVTGSPAIDASPDDADCEPIDQRGVSRPQGSACDIGAVEFVEEVLPIPDFAKPCGTTSTTGCKVNGVPNQPCIGTPGPDTIVATKGHDVIFGLDGNDIIKAGEGDDCVDGGLGNDTIEGQAGNDVLFGGGGKDQVRGGAGDDVIITGSGSDTVQGDEGDDLIYDIGGKNVLKGRDGNDVIYAPGTSGTIDGGSGTDVCIGGSTHINCP